MQISCQQWCVTFAMSDLLDSTQQWHYCVALIHIPLMCLGYHESQCVIVQVVRLIHKLSFVPNQLVSRAPPNVVR